MNWEAQGIRFVLYPAGVPLPDAYEVWKQLLAGREPENIQRPKGGAPGVTQSLAQGTVRGLVTTITVQPTRLDFLVGRPDAWMNEEAKPPNLDDLLEPALLYGAKCISSYPSARIALVLDLVQGAADWADAGAKFAAEIPLAKLPPVAREMTLALNGVRPFSATSGSLMNRLCKWETALYQYLMFAAGPASRAAFRHPNRA